MLKPQNPDQIGQTISGLWTFAFFTILFRDVHEMSTARTIEGILAGTYEGNVVTDAGLLFGGLALVVMLLTSLLSTLLVPSAVRRLNLIVAPIALLGGFYLLPNDPDDFLLGGVTMAAHLAIIVLCWSWKPAPSHDTLNGVHHGA